MTFKDESLDLHVTQDVMEHVFYPSRVWKEIARTLKPGGAHIFTVPLVNKTAPSTLRAKIDQNAKISHILPSVYHMSPISEEGSLVTVDWGFDIYKHIFDSCGLFTYTIYMDDITKGIRAEYIEVLMTIKPKPATILPNDGIP
jgi:SAM-dependent methyltransferase